MSHYCPPADEITILRSLGLTPTAAKCYLWLINMPAGRKASQVAAGLQLRPSSVHRALTELAEKGFIHKYKIAFTPNYRAIPITDALDNYADYQRQQARPLIRQQRRREADAA